MSSVEHRRIEIDDGQRNRTEATMRTEGCTSMADSGNQSTSEAFATAEHSPGYQESVRSADSSRLSAAETDRKVDLLP